MWNSFYVYQTIESIYFFFQPYWTAELKSEISILLRWSQTANDRLVSRPNDVETKLPSYLGVAFENHECGYNALNFWYASVSYFWIWILFSKVWIGEIKKKAKRTLIRFMVLEVGLKLRIYNANIFYSKLFIIITSNMLLKGRVLIWNFLFEIHVLIWNHLKWCEVSASKYWKT